LVTGGAGFIGSHLVERLLDQGHAVICLDNFNDYYDPQLKRSNVAVFADKPNVQLVEGDIRYEAFLDKVFSDMRPNEMVHLAAMVGVRPSLAQPRLYQDVNAMGTLNLLEMSRKHGLENFVFGSSSSVYGVNSKVPFSPDDPIALPISPYAATKRAAELMCHTYHHLYGMKITCLRFFTVYGPRQRPDLAIRKFTDLIERGEPVPVYGDGTFKRDYTYVDDIMQGVLSALERKFDFEIFNLGESQTLETLELVRLIENALGKKANVEHMPEQPGDVPITYADIDKSREMLGYDPQIKIEEGIPLFVEWFRAQKNVGTTTQR
jgi:UDP-glucuronate 4-epimerase